MSGARSIIDRRFLKELRQDRRSISAISKKINVPKSTLFDKMNRLEKEGVIEHRTLLDFSRLGFNAKIKVALRVPIPQRKDVGKWLCEHEHVNSVYKINHGYDFLFEAIFKDQKEASDFLKLFEAEFQIKPNHVFHVIEDLQKETFHLL